MFKNRSQIYILWTKKCIFWMAKKCIFEMADIYTLQMFIK